MGSSGSQRNKPHKARFSSKSSRNSHKENSARKPQHVSQKGRSARLHHGKNIRDQKRAAILAEKRLLPGLDVPPVVIVIVALTPLVNVRTVESLLLQQLKPAENISENDMEIECINLEEGTKNTLMTHLCHKHKIRLNIIQAEIKDLQGCISAAKVADVIAFVSTVTHGRDQLLDNRAKIALSMLRAQGLPTVIGLMQGLMDVPTKKRSDVKKQSVSALSLELPEDSKIFFADAADDFEQVFRFLSSHKLSNPQWKRQRPYVMAQQLEFVPNDREIGRGTLLISGYVRGRGLSVNHLVHLTGIGDFQLEKVDILKDPFVMQGVHNVFKQEQMQKEVSLEPDPTLKEPLIVENIPSTLEGEQTWPTEEELASAEKERLKQVKKRLLPKGTSEYQAAWILDECSDDDTGSDRSHDHIKDPDVGPEEDDGVETEERNHVYDDNESEEDKDCTDDYSEMMVDEVLTEEEGLELKRLKSAHAADEEFPDEVDTPLDVPARKRFARYRGLKSLRTSTWDPRESLPQEYGRIFSFENFQRTQKRVFGKAKEVDDGKLAGCVHLGAYVRLHVKGVPSSCATHIEKVHRKLPIVACGLLQHESKMSVVHFSIKKHESFLEPLKSKETLTFHTGFRVYKTRPIFSTDDINMNKHKMEKFLHPGCFSVASVFAPISFPPLPLIVFKESTDGSDTAFAASGSLKSVDPDRIILKRIILSGYPQRVQKQKAVIRYMFHNPEDVRWFKPLELWTKYGRRGRIKEPVGTHGAMKCVFDGVLQQRDAVCVSLYKRVYPKWPEIQ